MLRLFIYCLIIGLIFSSFGALKNSQLKLTIVKNQEASFKLPKENEFFSYDFDFYFHNQSDEDIVIISPEAYKISPNPWKIKIDGKVSRKWSGAHCAPNFTEKNKLLIRAGSSVRMNIHLSSFTSSFTKTPGVHSIQIQYDFNKKKSYTWGSKYMLKDVTPLSTDWSNKTKFIIK